ncbi:MAG TPA: hypothetical protein VN541_17820 [Tepidisphaeraceae bacterium]|nr:hypothetical protein [Tepidisphaeraceae bacterium]
MLKTLVFAMTAAAASVALAGPKEDVTDAAKKLSDASSYAWKSTSMNADGGTGAVVEGKTEKGGYTLLHITFGDNTIDMAIKGGKGAIKTDDGWKSLDEAAKGDDDQANRAKFMNRMAQSFKCPGEQAQEIASQTKELKESEGAVSGDLTEQGAKDLLLFYRPRTGESGGPEASNAKGSAKFWVKDGQLAKYETHVSGTVTFNGNDRDTDRTTTVEVSDVGSAKVEVPEDVKKKLP